MRIAYYRLRSDDLPIAAQREALGGGFDVEFEDVDVSNGLVAARRPGFAKLLGRIANGDRLHVLALDRLGRDTIDVQSTVRRLTLAGVTIEAHGIGPLTGENAVQVLATLAQLAELEYRRTVQRTQAARDAAWTSFVAAKPSPRPDRESLRRPMAADAATVLAWRSETGASIPETAKHFGLKTATVKRYGRLMADALDLAGRDAADPGYTRIGIST